MPITLHPISRRRFLARSLAGAAALASTRLTFGAAQPDPSRVVLFSDIHIDADRAKVDRGVNMFDHLQKSVAEVLAMDAPPAAVMINGDCAHLLGHVEDYKQVMGLVAPLREAGLPIHMIFGNHDNRENFWGSIPADEKRVKAVEDRQVLVVETQRADWVMLDSLQKTNATPGSLGADQLKWLAAELDLRAGKKVIVMVHHQLDERPVPLGLTDTKALLDVLLPRTQVKALLYGHTHVWTFEKREGLHCVNLPAVAYPFDTTSPTGWVDAKLSDSGMALELHCTDHAHPKHGEKHELVWRS